MPESRLTTSFFAYLTDKIGILAPSSNRVRHRPLPAKCILNPSAHLYIHTVLFAI